MRNTFTRIQYVRVSSYLKLVRWKCLYLRVDIQLLQYEGAQYERRVYSYIHIYRSDMVKFDLTSQKS
ncbi:unnamed protein product [Schistosoma rodhaini]|uniref:Uncharacterized protein n=1 Tax=Schistosoma rodhaini TaxID=6188 RepID=A0AA85F9S5_9TREM|nr:unnamed protein product [Schistosoma rodhaini]CAH8492835.1 unnamed protein product [Schistosoma rodhaini]